jgi:adenylate cyclase
VVGIKPLEAIGSDSVAVEMAAGIEAEVAAQLTKLEKVRVVSRTTMEASVGKGWTSRALADSLGIQYLLEGSVQHSGPNVVVTVRLVDARNDVSVWGESYRRALKDVILIRQDVGREVANALSGRL